MSLRYEPASKPLHTSVKSFSEIENCTTNTVASTGRSIVLRESGGCNQSTGGVVGAAWCRVPIGQSLLLVERELSL